MVGISESGNKARGLESDGSVEANIDLQSQLTTLSSGYSTASLNGTYAASCFGTSNGSMAELNYVSFDGNGNLLGVDVYNYSGSQGNQPISGTYSGNGDGTFAGTLSGSYTFNGVMEAGVSQIEYTYNQAETGGVMACVGKQATSEAANLLGYYGILVGGTGENVWGRDNLSGSVYFDGAGGLTSTNLNGGLASGFSNTTATGTYTVNSDNTISITLHLAGQDVPQTYVVAASSGKAASGIETDGTAVATIDLQSQLQPPGTTYNLSSLQGTYSASCGGYEVDLNWVTFDGNGHILASVDAYDDGYYGDNPYTGTYTVNSDGTFIGNFDGPIYNVFTMTGVLDNGTAEMEYSYYQAGFGEVVTCIGESTYGPVGPNPVAAAPSFTPAPGAYNSAQSITLTAAPGALIYYTTDGTAPTPFAAAYSGPIPVNATTTIQALAVATGYNNSAIAAGTYFISSSQVSGQSQTITFPGIPTQVFPAGPLTLGATSSSGLPVSYIVVSGPAMVSGNVLTIAGAGSVTVQASQAGNGQYAPAIPVSQTFTINQATTIVSLTASTNPSSVAQPITFTATVVPQNGGQVTGTVSFQDGSNVLGVSAIGANVATITISSLAIGTHSMNAVYGGDSNFVGSVATPVAEVVTPAATATTLVPSINPAVSGQQVTFTATVSSPLGTPTGYVQFLNGATVLAKMTLKSGAVKYGTGKLAAGSNAITAVYLGDSNHNGSISTSVSEFVRSVTTTTLGSAPNPSVYGQAVVLTASVRSAAGAPPDGETVTFKLGQTTLGTGTLTGGVATFSTSALGTGSKALTSVYGGDDAWVASTSKAYIQVIGKASTATTLTSSQNPGSYGQPVTFTATVTPQFGGVPTGNVTFRDGSKLLKTVALSGGVANFTTSTLSRAAHNITATYAGNAAGFMGSSGSLTQSVN
jgi:hypothetical protein